MPLRAAIVKGTATGENVTVDVCQWNPVTGEVMHTVAEMQQMAQEMLAIADVRQHEMNMSMLEVYNFEKYVPADVWPMVVSILDVLAGRIHPDELIRRWESAREENADLARMREAYVRDGEVQSQCGCHVAADGGVTLCEKHSNDAFG